MFESVPSGGDAIFMKVCVPPPPPILAGFSLDSPYGAQKIVNETCTLVTCMFRLLCC